jgi:hypothetical protein
MTKRKFLIDAVGEGLAEQGIVPAFRASSFASF